MIVLSPAKTLKRLTIPHVQLIQKYFTKPKFLEEAKELVKKIQKLNEKELQKLLDVSSAIAKTNFERYQNFPSNFEFDESYPSIFLFFGDVYKGFEWDKYTYEDLLFLQDNVRILSGLYGILKPFDLIYPYRLEMGTEFKTFSQKFNFQSLYEFWGDKITHALNEELSKQKNKHLVNLASHEYFQVIDTKNLKYPILNIHFQEKRNGRYVTIALNSKRARGIMTNWIVKNRIQNPNDLKNFQLNGYHFSEEKSDDSNFYFLKN